MYKVSHTHLENFKETVEAKIKKQFEEILNEI